MTAKFTPGPWGFFKLLSGSENDKGFRVLPTAGLDGWIADVGPLNDENGDASPEGIANARLIAAAPALYEALAEADIALEAAPDTANRRIARQKIRAALSLARGEQS